jgi:hypothetical protein
VTVSTVKKSVAKMPCACARNSFHVGPRRWSKAVASKGPADRARRDADPETTKLTLDADTAPSLVLTAEPDDELYGLIGKRRASRPSLCSPSFPLAP